MYSVDIDNNLETDDDWDSFDVVNHVRKMREKSNNGIKIIVGDEHNPLDSAYRTMDENQAHFNVSIKDKNVFENLKEDLKTKTVGINTEFALNSTPPPVFNVQSPQGIKDANVDMIENKYRITEFGKIVLKSHVIFEFMRKNNNYSDHLRYVLGKIWNNDKIFIKELPFDLIREMSIKKLFGTVNKNYSEFNINFNWLNAITTSRVLVAKTPEMENTVINWSKCYLYAKLAVLSVVMFEVNSFRDFLNQRLLWMIPKSQNRIAFTEDFNLQVTLRKDDKIESMVPKWFINNFVSDLPKNFRTIIKQVDYEVKSQKITKMFSSKRSSLLGKEILFEKSNMVKKMNVNSRLRYGKTTFREIPIVTDTQIVKNQNFIHGICRIICNDKSILHTKN
jgi:hypothetical protein